jgi:hypothetical protein
VPVPALFGAVGQPAGGAAFVGKTTATPAGTSATISFPPGTAAGHLAIIIETYCSNATPPAGWALRGSFNWTLYGYLQVVIRKVLTAGDISTGSVSLTGLAAVGGTIMLLVYSGPTECSVVSTTESAAGATDLEIAGFTKTAGCKAIVAYVSDRDPSSPIVPPGTVVNRIANFNGTFFTSRADDILNPSNYVDGTKLIYTAFEGTNGEIGQILQLT